MFDDNFTMRSRLWALLLVLGACTKPNPASCLDEFCNDPALPFCDVDGSIGGVPDTCIAVACEPDTFEACRDDQAIVCEATGNTFSLEQCQFGCDSSFGCKACLTDEQCSSESPICESSTCRVCLADDECPSRICDGGQCAEDSILYASATGSNADLCRFEDPCSIATAIAAATGASPQPRIRMLPGVYTQSLVISGFTSNDLQIVATGAQLVSTLDVTQGNVAFRGLDITSITNFAVQCSAPDGFRSTLTLLDATIRAGNSSVNLVTTGRCNLTIVNADIDLAQSTGTAITLAQNTTANFDRIFLHGDTSPGLLTFSPNSQLTVTNSVLDDR